MVKYVDEWVHACHATKLPDGSDAVVIKVHRHFEDGSVKPEITIVDKPRRSFYVTKPAFRNHKFKKERESIDRLDRYVVPNSRLAEELNKVLNGDHKRSKYLSIPKLCDSQYVYGADISIETLIKHNFQQKFEASGLNATPLTTGFLDIETDVLSGNNNINIITVTHENRVYTAILDDFITIKQPDGSFRKGSLDEVIEFSTKTLDCHINELLTEHVKKNPKSRLKQQVEANPFEYFYYVGRTVIDLIKWIYKQIHNNRTDFIGVWNINFDIPKILTPIKEEGLSPEDIFCPPELSSNFRYVKYQADEKKTDSIFKKWHWLHATSYSQFIDSQNLYCILRTVKGGEIGGYKLDNVLKSNDLGGKLTFKDDNPDIEHLAELDWHRYMQRNEALKYIVYNQFDCISLQLMEWKNSDLSSMSILGGVSQLCKWTRQTRKMADSLYFDLLSSGHIIASAGQNMETEFDALIDNTGGAVLRPERTSNIGIKIFSDRPDITTMLHTFVGDVDFSGMYPQCLIILNASKDTKISCGISIDGMTRDETLRYYSLIIGMRENAVLLGTNYFGLPGYEELASRFAKRTK